jgi:hypothetical protein
LPTLPETLGLIPSTGEKFIEKGKVVIIVLPHLTVEIFTREQQIIFLKIVKKELRMNM